MTRDLIKHDQGGTVTNDAFERLGSGRDQRLVGLANVLVCRGRRLSAVARPELPREFAPKRPCPNTAVIDAFGGVEIGTHDASYCPPIGGKPFRAGDDTPRGCAARCMAFRRVKRRLATAVRQVV